VTISEALDDAESNECLFSLRHLPQSVLQTIPARNFRDGPSIDYLRLAGWWLRRARLLMYRLPGQPPRIPDERSETTEAYADETVSTVESDDVYRRPYLPQRDTPERSEERREQLDKARGIYRYRHGYIETEPTGEQPVWHPPPWYRRVFRIYESNPGDRKTVPMPLPPFVRKLPPGEGYSRVVQGRLYGTLAVSYLALVLSRFETWRAKRHGLDVYRVLLLGFRDKPLTMKHWREDAEFARQWLAGGNLRMCRRFTEIPENVPVTDAALAGLRDVGETLASSIEKKRRYWCNDAVLDGISVKPGRYLAHPIALDFSIAVGSNGAFELMGRIWREQWSMDSQDVPLDLTERGMDDVEALPDYPWRDDALKLWAVIQDDIAAMVEHFYASGGAWWTTTSCGPSTPRFAIRGAATSGTCRAAKRVSGPATS
jgi:hypothetical protein